MLVKEMIGGDQVTFCWSMDWCWDSTRVQRFSRPTIHPYFHTITANNVLLHAFTLLSLPPFCHCCSANSCSLGVTLLIFAKIMHHWLPKKYDSSVPIFRQDGNSRVIHIRSRIYHKQLKKVGLPREKARKELICAHFWFHFCWILCRGKRHGGIIYAHKLQWLMKWSNVLVLGLVKKIV